MTPNSDKPQATGQPMTDQSEAMQSLQRQLAGLQADLDRIEAQRSALWSQIAEIRARSLAAGELSGPLTRSDRKMRDLMHERERRLEEINGLLGSRETRRAARDRALDKLARQADAAGARYQAARQALDAKLKANDQYQALSARQQASRQALAKLEQRLQTARLERDRKIGRYLSDPLFAYLHRRGYKTERYKSWALTYRMDRWIADIVDYDQARRDYELLQEMPRWLAEHVAYQSRLAGEAREALDDYLERDEQARDVALLEQRAADAERTLHDQRATAGKTAAEDATLEEQLDAFEQRQDASAVAMRALYREAFRGQPTTALIKLSRQTTTGDDERAVRQIERLDREETHINTRITQLQTMLEEQTDS